jgi:hypothetical protein
VLTDDRPAGADPVTRGARRLRRPSTLLTGALVGVVVFLVDAWPRIAAPFGNSHDGRNASVWVLGADSLLEHGPLTSRLGAWAPLRGTYAHHPPLITPLTAIARAVGDHPAIARAPAWIASVLAIVLLVHLVRRAGASPAAAVAATLLVVGTPMFLVYGAMLNMEALSLPCALALLLAWQPPCWPSARRTAVVAGIGALVSFPGVLLGGVLSLVALWRRRRERRALLPHEAGTLAGTAIGSALTVAWLWWANGGLGEMVDQARIRSSSGRFGVAAFADRQLSNLFLTVPPWTVVLAVVGLAIVLRRRSWSLPLAVSGAVVVAFAVGLSDGAWVHVYWNYLVLVPVALVVAPALDEVADRWGGRGPRALLALGVAGLLAGAAFHTLVHEELDYGRQGLAVATADPAPRSTTPFLCTIQSTDWLAFVTGRPVERLDGPGLGALARTDPRAPVFVVLPAVPERLATWDDVAARALATDAGHAWIEAGDLADVLGPAGTGSDACG